MEAVLHVLNDNGSGHRTAVPLSPDITGQDVLDCVQDPGYRMVHLVARWQGKEFLVLPSDSIVILLQEFGQAGNTDSVDFVVRYEETDTATAYDCDHAGRRSQFRRGSTPTRDISRPQWPHCLPGGGANLTLSQLQELASRQQVAMETQQQALVARETRLKYLQQQEARHRQLSNEQARLQRMRERVEAQELKLKKLRALRGQVEQYKASNGNLNSELEAVRALFNEKEKELAMAVSKVDQLMKQLQDVKAVRTKELITNNNSSKGDSKALNLELEKLKNELLHRNKLNEQQNSRLVAQRHLLQQRKDEVTKMDKRIHELQQRLKKRRSQQQQQQSPTLPNAVQSTADFKVNGSKLAETKKPVQNIAAVEPIQHNAKDAVKDAVLSKTGFLKQDLNYQVIPPNTKLIPVGEGGPKPSGSVIGGEEVNNNNKSSTGASGVKPVEYKIPAIISSHFDSRRGQGSSTVSKSVTDNQNKTAGTGISGPAVTKSVTPSTSTQGSGSNSNSQQPVNTEVKGPRPFVNTFATKSGLPKWPPDPVKDDEEQQPTQSPPSHQPQINIFDEERQAGSGQSSPASSEGSGPLLKQGSGVFSHTLVPSASHNQPTAASSGKLGLNSEQSKVLGKSGPPLQPKGDQSNVQGSRPLPRIPQNILPVKSFSSEERSSGANTKSEIVGETDTSRLNVSDSISFGPPQAQSTPVNSSSPAADGKPGPTVHLNQRPAQTYRYASKSVIANTYMGRLGNAALERYQKLNKHLYGTLETQSDRREEPPSSNSFEKQASNGTAEDAQSAATSQQPSPSAPLVVDVVSGQGGMTHFGLVGSPNYPDIASDKGSYKANTPKHVRRRHSDSDNEDAVKLFHRVDKSQQPLLENVMEDNGGVTSNGSTTHFEAKVPNLFSAVSNLNSAADGNKDSTSPLSPSKMRPEQGSNKTESVVLRQKKTILKKENKRKSMNRVSFDPLALLLDASLEGELELVKRTSKEVEDVSTPNDEGITALHNAICAGHYDIVKFLIEFGADVNSPDSDGWTPLHCAASCNNLPMVRFLVEHGACIFATTISDNETAAEKCEEDEDGYDGCSDYLYSVQEKLGIVNDGTVYAVFNYISKSNDELSFRISDKMTVLRKGDETEKEWWWARKSGKEGYIPRNLLGLHPRILPSNYQPLETSEC